MYWLGLDVGTGGSRALLVDSQGAVRASFTAPHQEMRMLKPMWAEQDPDDWWHAGQLAIQGVLREGGREWLRDQRHRSDGPDAWPRHS